MKQNPMKGAEEAQHEARVKAAVAEFKRSPEAKKGMRVIPEEPSPAIEILSRVFQKEARRKVN